MSEPAKPTRKAAMGLAFGWVMSRHAEQLAAAMWDELKALNPKESLDVQELADAFTWFHVRTEGRCSESHLADARNYLAVDLP